jgi:DNA-binding NtrC family response regulator
MDPDSIVFRVLPPMTMVATPPRKKPGLNSARWLQRSRMMAESGYLHLHLCANEGMIFLCWLEYLVERYAKRSGKRIRHIKKKTLDLLEAYDWPGNIREMQNIIERAVILCDGQGEPFSIDESWLQRKSNPLHGRRLSRAGILAEHKKELVERERKAIEAALAECQGRISGPSGAAAKLGIPHQTLESKISSLGIDKRRFKGSHGPV